MLISKAQERDLVGNKVPENMVAAEERLELLSEATIKEAESRDWTENGWIKKTNPKIHVNLVFSIITCTRDMRRRGRLLNRIGLHRGIQY